jgi:hypothetical protein
LTSKHDKETITVILVGILNTKPLILIKGQADRQASGYKQGKVAQLVYNICKNFDTNLLINYTFIQFWYVLNWLYTRIHPI